MELEWSIARKFSTKCAQTKNENESEEPSTPRALGRWFLSIPRTRPGRNQHFYGQLHGRCPRKSRAPLLRKSDLRKRSPHPLPAPQPTRQAGGLLPRERGDARAVTGNFMLSGVAPPHGDLRQNSLHHFTRNIGQAVVAALGAEDHAGMIDSKLLQNRRLQVMHVHRVLGD